MKTLFALTALVIAGSSLAQSTSQTELSVSQKPFSERIGFWYYGEMTKGNLAGDNTEPDADFLNYLNGSFDISESLRFNLTLRGNFTDNLSDDTKRFTHWDPRFGIDYNREGLMNRFRTVIEAPTSEASQDDDKIARLKLYTYFTGKQIDDYNVVGFIFNYNKDFFENPEPRSETSQYYLTEYFTWTNSRFSETYRFKVDLELYQEQKAGESDLSFGSDKSSERVLVGMDTDLLDINFYPYLYHTFDQVAALDTLGAGVQIFKAF